MSRHLVTAELVVEADSWQEAELYVRDLEHMLGPSSDLEVWSAKWEEEIEDEGEDNGNES